jgi:hypothetical protein
MDMQASHEFLAELKVLTHVHHLNLVSDLFLYTATTYLICDFPLRFLYFLTYKANRHYIYVWSTCYSDVDSNFDCIFCHYLCTCLNCLDFNIPL